METSAQKDSLTLEEASRLFYRDVLGVRIPHRAQPLSQKNYSTPQIQFQNPEPQPSQDLPFYSISDLAKRWRCSRATIYNRLRAEGARVLDFAPRGKKGKKVVSAVIVCQIENRRTKRLC